MEPTDVTIEILKGIREEGRKTNERLDELRTEVRTGFVELRTGFGQLRTGLGQLQTGLGQLQTGLGQLQTGLGTTNDKLEALATRQTQTEVRLATELAGVAGAVREVRDLLREDHAWRHRVEDHERRLLALERRTG